MSLVYSAYQLLIGTAIVFMARSPVGEAQLCDGYEVTGHCYKLFKVRTNWLNATKHCETEGRGQLVTVYTTLQQTYLERYLKAENVDVNDVWTSGQRLDSNIWGNPESLWRWVGECDSECSKTGCDGGRLDMAFVIDASGSMASGDGWSLTKNFFQSLLSILDVGDDKVRISIVIYSSKEEMEETKLRKKLLDEGIANNKPALIEILQYLRYLDGNTDTADVLKLLRTSVFRLDRGDRRDSPNVAIILTDGKSTDSQLTKEEATLTKDSGIQLFVVGVTEGVEISEIEAVSSAPQVEGQTYFLVKTYADLSEAVNNVSRQLCYWNKILNVVNISAISAQGCYDNRNEDGLTEEVSVVVSSPDVCVLACKDRGYLFAGVGYTAASPDVVCRCGNEFGKGGPTDHCTLPCPSTPFSNTNLCGGMNRNFVYKTDGVYGKWIYDEPNNYNDLTRGNDGVEFCAAVNSMDEDVFTFVDENCTKKFSFLCETHMAYCDGSAQTERGFRYFTMPTDSKSSAASICVSMSINVTERRSWYAGRRYCQDRGGDLLRLTSFEQNEELTKQIKSNKQIQGDKFFWVGLYKENFFWMDGFLTEFKWTNFANDEPQFERGDCIYIDPESNYKWRVANCSENKYFVCDLVRTAWSSTSKTVQSTAKGPPAVITASQEETTLGLLGPDNKASKSTSDQFSVTKYWWLILLLCLLLLLLIILLLIFCCYRGGYAKVGPKIYDARPIADAPISTVLGYNEPYNFFVDSNSQVDLVVGSTIHGVPESKRWNKTITSVSGHDDDDFYAVHDVESIDNKKIEII